MNIEKFMSFCEKNALHATPEKYGYNYFRNAPALIIDGAQVVTDWKTENTARAVRKYCARYGFAVFGWRNGGGENIMNIVPAADFAVMELYRVFCEKSVADCEKEMHENRTPGLNARLSEIMDQYGKEYNAARLATEKKSA